eukprot:7573903-Alexandrium_andersonii.AAC.1
MQDGEDKGLGEPSQVGSGEKLTQLRQAKAVLEAAGQHTMAASVQAQIAEAEKDTEEVPVRKRYNMSVQFTATCQAKLDHAQKQVEAAQERLLELQKHLDARKIDLEAAEGVKHNWYLKLRKQEEGADVE